MSKNSPILNAIYETARGMHNCGAFSDEQMKKYEELAPKPSPINLDGDVFNYFNKKCGSNREKLQILINDLLRKELQNTQPV